MFGFNDDTEVINGMEKKGKALKEWKERALETANTFKTPDGKRTLRTLLLDCGMFSSIPSNDEQAIARYNMAVSLLADMGVFRMENVDALIEAFLDLSYKGE